MIIIHIARIMDDVYVNAFARVREDEFGRPCPEVTLPLGTALYPTEGAVGPEVFCSVIERALRQRGEAVSQLPFGWHGLI